MKRLQNKTIIVAGLMVSLVAFTLTQFYNIHQLQTDGVEYGANRVIEVTDSSS